LKGTGKLIGAIGLVGVKGNERGMGYWIGEPYWGLSYCTEAAKTFVEFCFENLNLTRIDAEHLVINLASGRVMKKIGMISKNSRMIKDRNGHNAKLNVYEIKK